MRLAGLEDDLEDIPWKIKLKPQYKYHGEAIIPVPFRTVDNRSEILNERGSSNSGSVWINFWQHKIQRPEVLRYRSRVTNAEPFLIVCRRRFCVPQHFMPCLLTLNTTTLLG